MIRHFIAFIALGVSLLLPAHAHGRPARAVASPDSVAVLAQAAPSPSSTVPETRPVSGLPLPEPPPRTLKEFWHVFVLVSLAWVGIVVCLLRCGPSMGRIAQRVGQIDTSAASR